jgi:hypothetical protein
LLSWIRRGRYGGDDWQQAEIPLGEALEEYQLQVAHAGGAIVRAAVTGSQQWSYTAAAIAADFGTMPAELDLTVRQRSMAAGWGIPATARLSIA